ncbi:MAG TPA: ATP-binding protein [Nonomuraea sp.]|nr:ATP-binding protein [Nonomuraea sp.]
MTGEFELRCPISPDLGYIRDLVRIHGRHHGLSGDRLEDLALAVNEAVINVLDHGGQAGLVTARGHEHGVSVEVLDVGGRLSDAHLADVPVDPRGGQGFGLWVIRHLCDEVTLEQTGLGSVLGLHFHGDSAAVIPIGRSGGRPHRSTRTA